MTDWKDMLSSIYGLATDLKNVLYDLDLLDSVHLPVPVLSVGNLSVGGTGKTPLVQSLLSLAVEREIRTAVISRNYRARSRGIHKVDPQRPDGASFYGDEAFMLSLHFPQVAVWTGPKKFLTAQEALKNDFYQLLIVDDGFQHRALHRDFDLVLLDCTSAPSSEQVVPKGRLREDFASLERATAVALTKVNWAPSERVESLRQNVPAAMEIYEVEFHLKPLRIFSPGMRVLLVSGVASSDVFEKQVKAWTQGSIEICDHIRFQDHYEYTEKDVIEILRRMKSLDCHEVVTTEKDFVKLQVFPDLAQYLNPVLVSTQFRQSPQGIYAFLDQCLRT